MSSSNSDSDSNIILVEETREEIKYTNVNIARLRQDLPKIIREIIQEELDKFLRERRKPKRYVEVGYRG